MDHQKFSNEIANTVLVAMGRLHVTADNPLITSFYVVTLTCSAAICNPVHMPTFALRINLLYASPQQLLLGFAGLKRTYVASLIIETKFY